MTLEKRRKILELHQKSNQRLKLALITLSAAVILQGIALSIAILRQLLFQ